jgi:diguanylate cyclase (GGDEF)-like protein/PAS domain S-box-containing protein
VFPLLRYFSLASLATVVLTTVFLATLHHHAERDQLLDIGESNHVALTQSLANALLPEFRRLAEAARTLDVEALRTNPAVETLRPRLVEAMRNTPVIKVKFYDTGGRTIYSTDPAQIGKDYSANAGFQSALRGQPASELTHRDHFSTFDREIEDRDVLASYVALRAGQDQPIEGVIEVYSDVTDWVRRSDRQAWVLTSAIVFALLVLYAVLFLVVRRASGIMRVQYDELQRSGAELRIAATAFEIQLSMVVTDANGIIIRVNRAFSEGTGYSPAEAVGKPLSLLRSGRHDEAFYATLWNDIRNIGSWQGEIWNRSKDGDVHPDWLSISAVLGPDGQITHYVATLIDISQRLAEEEKIKLLAFYDPLTMLPNRRLLQDRLHHALAASGRSGRHGGLMFIDLDHFKEVNDSLGHEAGDKLLEQVGERLKECVRQTDTVARWGGDEFVVMLEGLEADSALAREQLAAIAGKLHESLSRPYRLGTGERVNTPSIGVTLFNGQQASVSDLLRNSDTAMYQAKFAGRNRVSFFDTPAAG